MIRSVKRRIFYLRSAIYFYLLECEIYIHSLALVCSRVSLGNIVPRQRERCAREGAAGRGCSGRPGLPPALLLGAGWQGPRVSRCGSARFAASPGSACRPGRAAQASRGGVGSTSALSAKHSSHPRRGSQTSRWVFTERRENTAGRAPAAPRLCPQSTSNRVLVRAGHREAERAGV